MAAASSARAALVADLYGRERYGSVGGALALVVSISRACAPVGASLVAAAGGYAALLSILVILSIVAAAAVLASAPRPVPIASTPALP